MPSTITYRFKKLRNHSQNARPSYFASLPANYIDELDKEEYSSIFGKLVNHIKRKFIFTFFFVPLAILDFFTSAFATLGLTVASWNSSEESYKTYVVKYAEQTSKNFLAVVFSWIGVIFSPKLVSFFFIEDNQLDHQVASGGKLYVSEVKIEEIYDTENPAEQLAQVFKGSNGRPVTVRGSGFSQGEQFITKSGQPIKQILVDLNKIKHVELIDIDRKIVKVTAGATWEDIQNYANDHKMAVKVMQASNVFSIGGSIGTNVHGWDHHNGTVSNTIRAVTVVDAKGEIHTYRKGVDKKFNLVFGSFGTMGIVTEVELELTDNEVLHERGFEVIPKDYNQWFEENALDPNVRMHLYRLSLEKGKLLQSGVAVNYIKEDDAQPVKTENLVQEGARGTRFERIAMNLMRRSRFLQTQYWQYEKKRILEQSEESATQTTNRIMQPIINAMMNSSGSESEWLQEYFVPRDKLAAFLKSFGKLLDDNDIHMINATVRYVKKDEISPLPYAPEDRYAVVICFNQVLQPTAIAKTEKWVRQAANMAIENGGAPYMPYQSFLTEQQYEAAYGKARVDAFRELKHAHDPDTVFDTGLYRKYMAQPYEESQPNIFQTLMSNEDYKLAFRGFIDNVLCRLDADKFYALLEDITSYCDTYEEVYQKLQDRISEAMPGVFGDLSNVLHSLSAIKEDLVNQASQFKPKGEKIDGMLEIGYPGRFISKFKQTHNIQGNAYVMLDGESVTDYIQTGIPRPYKKAFELDYNNPVASMKTYLEQAGESSVEVITCYIGLHHFPDDQLDEFLTLVRKALKPGGQFMLVDHNVESEQDMLMAQLAHAVFNVVTGETVENDVTEVRNFCPMSYWQALCEKHDLGMAMQTDEPLIRDGDPSRNQMVSFTKLIQPSAISSILKNDAVNEAEHESSAAKVNVDIPKSSKAESIENMGLHSVGQARAVSNAALIPDSADKPSL